MRATVTAPSPEKLAFINWIVRRRIPISLITFTGLIVVNLLVLKTPPVDLTHLTFNPLGALGLVITGLGIAVRSWAAGTLHKCNYITQSGPYALVRNPLYFGSFLMMLGFCILLKDLPSFLFVCGPMAALYWAKVRDEEKNLSSWFPEEWRAYAARVPRFVPYPTTRKVLHGWSLSQWLKNREYQAMVASLVGVAAVYYLSWSYYSS